VRERVGRAVRDALLRRRVQQDLELPELVRLEPAGRRELVAEREEVLRRERLHHGELLDQQMEHLPDATEMMHDVRDRFLGHLRRREVIARDAELAKAELEQSSYTWCTMMKWSSSGASADSSFSSPP
jgi:hypothetical protein